MALNTLGLGFLFTARDMASGVMARVNRSFNQTASKSVKSMSLMQGAMVATGVGLAAVGAGIGILAASFGAANQFAAFEQSIAAVGAVTKASADELNQLKDAAIEAGIATQFSPDEATQGLLALSTAGQMATDATKTLIPVLDLAAGSLGQLGVAESAEAVVGTLNAYGKSAEEATGVTDQLLRITQLTNFQARDFSIGLSKAAAAGAVFDQDLNDVLITMGLLRNRNIDASSSATAFRESLRRIGSDKNAQKAITDLKVDIFDADKEMRSIVDIMSDFATATKTMGAEERNRSVVQAFGARGLLAFNAIQKAQVVTMKDGTKVTLEGAEAIAHLRKEMGSVEGTAQAFREALLDTFEGQKTLLKGSLETLGVVAGEGFAATFKPVIAFLIRGLNILIQTIKATPTPVKQAFAAMVALFGVVLTGGGATLMFAGALALLIPVIKVVAIIMAAVVLALLPLIAALAGVTFAVLGFVVAFQEIDGLGDKAGNFVDKIKLGFRALSQAFSQGGFSGEVKDELNEAGNVGIKNFVIKLFLFVERIKNAWDGMVTGFRKTIRDAAPLFEELDKALTQLGRRLGILGDEADADDAATKFEKWGKIGTRVGIGLATAFLFLVSMIIWMTNMLTAASDAFDEFEPVLTLLEEPMSQLNDSIGLLGRQFGAANGEVDEATGSWTGFATVLKFVLLLATAMIGSFLTLTSILIGGVAGGISAVWNVMKALFVGVWGALQVIYLFLTGQWGEAWKVAGDTVLEVGRLIVNAVFDMAAAIANALDAIGAAAGKDLGLAKGVAAGQARFNKDAAESKRARDGTRKGGIQTGAPDPLVALALQGRALPSAAPAPAFVGPPLPPEALKAQAAADAAAGAEVMRNAISAGMKALPQPAQTIITKLIVDGDVLAEAVKKAEAGGSDFAAGDAPQE